MEYPYLNRHDFIEEILGSFAAEDYDSQDRFCMYINMLSIDAVNYIWSKYDELRVTTRVELFKIIREEIQKTNTRDKKIMAEILEVLATCIENEEGWGNDEDEDEHIEKILSKTVDEPERKSDISHIVKNYGDEVPEHEEVVHVSDVYNEGFVKKYIYNGKTKSWEFNMRMTQDDAEIEVEENEEKKLGPPDPTNGLRKYLPEYTHLGFKS